MRLSPLAALNRFLAVQSFLFGARVGSLRFFSKKTRDNLFMRSKNNDCFDAKSLAPKYFPKTENQKIYFSAVNNPKIPIVLGVGPAGTGKTLFACTAAIEALKHGKIQKIVLTRPIVPVDEEELGFLPGDLKNKMAPWTQPLFDIFLEYYSKMALDLMVKEGVIEISPLAFMRGRTFKKCFIIADEMQNSSPNQMMMLTTRIGTDTRLFITGDLAQKDRAGLNGLLDFVVRSSKCDSLVDQGLVKIVNFGVTDVERSMIVNRVVEMYNPNTMAQQYSIKNSSSTTEKLKDLFFKPNATYPYSYSTDFPLMVNHTIVKNITEVALPDQTTKSLVVEGRSHSDQSNLTDWSPGITVNGTKLCTCTKTKPASNDCALIPKEHVSENLRRMDNWSEGLPSTTNF